MTIQKILITVTILSQVQAIWPPSYKINLTHEEIFVISEELSSDDVDDVYQAEDEMIKEEELKKFNIQDDSGKYLRLHQLSVRRNNENANRPFYNKKNLKKSREVYYEDVQPWEGGFVDKNGVLKSAGKIFYNPNKLNKEENKTGKNEGRRDASNKDENYDYGSLKAEYYSNIKTAKVSNDTVNYTETKEEESFKDAVKAIVGDTKKPRNCTAEEKKGIGLAAAECFWSDLKKPDLKENERSGIFRRIITIIFIWILVYLLVAIPCWCQKGWCCCCFQCKICKPQERIDIAKKYLLDNPVGVYHTPDNQKLTYTPTNYEKYAQKKLEKALLKL